MDYKEMKSFQYELTSSEYDEMERTIQVIEALQSTSYGFHIENEYGLSLSRAAFVLRQILDDDETMLEEES